MNIIPRALLGPHPALPADHERPCPWRSYITSQFTAMACSGLSTIVESENCQQLSGRELENLACILLRHCWNLVRSSFWAL
jgi:hypothetical protein